MRLTDSHCHLTHGRLAGQVEDVLKRAAQTGVVACVCASGDLEEAEAGRRLCRRFAARADLPRLKFTAGIHPHQAKSAPVDLAAQLAELAGDADCVAVGEIGLDYHYDFSPRPAQRQAFEAQLAVARQLGARVVIHTREAFDDTLAILRASGVDGRSVVFHSCTQDQADVARILDFGAMVGFSGIATFKNADYLRLAAGLVGDDRIMVETDAPYLSPEPLRAMRNNEPANVAHVAAALAAARKMAAEAFAELTTQNAMRFFSMGPGQEKSI